MHRQRAVSSLLATAAFAALGCRVGPGEAPVSEAVLPIIGGSLAETCVWPTAVMLEGPMGCSATLVHPRVVVTAKHCLVTAGDNPTPPTHIGLGETRNQWARMVDVSRCVTHPNKDLGFCILAEDVTGIPIIPVMAPCEASELAAGKAIVEVGFGVTSAAGRTYGNKKWINGTIDSAAPGQDEFKVTSGSQDGEYFGDSGGPLFFQMPDGTWRVIGEDCCSLDVIPGSTAPRVSTYESVPYHVAWVEKASGIDLTPCHDANGWNPTDACTGFPVSPGEGVGTWSTMCQGETTLRQQTCRATFPDAGTDGARGLVDAGADAASRDGPNDGPAEANPDDSYAGDSEADLGGDGNTGWTDGGDDLANIRDSGGMGGPAGSAEAGADAPIRGLDGAAGSDSGASAGAGGNSADGGDSKSDGSPGGNPSGERESGGETTGSGGTSGRDGSSGWDAPGDRDGSSGSIVDGGVDQKAAKASGGGCACNSVSGRDTYAWPGLLAVGLAATRLIRRRARR